MYSEIQKSYSSPAKQQTLSYSERSYGASNVSSPYKPCLVGSQFQKTFRSFRKRGGDPVVTQNQENGDHETNEATPILSPEKTPPEVITNNSEFMVIREMLFTNPINLLLVFVPLSFVAHYFSWSNQAIFWINFFAMIPLACILGDLTDEVALHTNQTIGGLINATFGNAVEVVVAIQALKFDEFRIVQTSMIGSIYSNLLLVLGCSFFFGGLKHSEQTYNPVISTANMGLLLLSSIAFVLPTPFAEYTGNDDDTLNMSRTVAIALILMYVQLLIFQLKTHRDLFDDENDQESNDEDEGKMKPDLSLPTSLLYLTLLTILISILSDFLVGSIDGFCETSGMSKSFVGLIIIPVIGNAVEHLTAVRSAMYNKMDLALGVAVGSSTQISIFVAPLTVIIGWIMDKPMTLTYANYEIALYVLSVLVVALCSSNAKSNWLEGSILITTYALVAVGFWFEGN